MPVRGSMAAILARCRLMIGDPTGANQFFQDQDIQDTCDGRRDDNWYELLKPALTVVNSAGTNNQVNTIWADYYSRFHAPEAMWESDATLLGNNVSTGANWVVITPVASDYIVGHWQFELNQFTTATAPGQYPPVFIWGKVYDLYRICADLCEIWASGYQLQFDFSTSGKSFHRTQIFDQLMKKSAMFRSKARPRSINTVRSDYPTPSYSRSVPILGDVNGDWTRQ